jgi:single-strand selective monofunctional uracil DNA glycosylase
MNPAEGVLAAEKALSLRLSALAFAPPVAAVLDPLTYAWEPHARYVRRYAASGQILLLGMNPGPHGMAQTGVPFGSVPMVREFLHIDGRVGQPAQPHPRRPILGFECGRAEVSGTRLWGWAQARFGTAEAFFARFFVLSWCPLIFLEESGRNRVPEQLPRAEQRPLFAACDATLTEIVAALAPARCVGIGRLATSRLTAVGAPRVGGIPHPSPASPAANRGWVAATEAALRDLGVDLG